MKPTPTGSATLRAAIATGCLAFCASAAGWKMIPAGGRLLPTQGLPIAISGVVGSGRLLWTDRGDGIQLRSADFGRTWQTVYPAPVRIVDRLELENGGLLGWSVSSGADTTFHFHLSEDDGDHWTEIGATRAWHTGQPRLGRISSTLFAAGDDELMRSSDGGKTWSDISSRLVSAGPAPRRFRRVLYFRVVGRHLVMRVDTAAPGTSLQLINPLVVTSADQGETWSAASSWAPWFSRQEARVAGVWDGKLLVRDARTRPAGYHLLDPATGADAVVPVPADTGLTDLEVYWDRLYFHGGDGRGYFSRDGVDWTSDSLTRSGFAQCGDLSAGSAMRGDTILNSCRDVILRSTDGGRTWRSSIAGIFNAMRYDRRAMEGLLFTRDDDFDTWPTNVRFTRDGWATLIDSTRLPAFGRHQLGRIGATLVAAVADTEDYYASWSPEISRDGGATWIPTLAGFYDRIFVLGDRVYALESSYLTPYLATRPRVLRDTGKVEEMLHLDAPHNRVVAVQLVGGADLLVAQADSTGPRLGGIGDTTTRGLLYASYDQGRSWRRLAVRGAGPTWRIIAIDVVGSDFFALSAPTGSASQDSLALDVFRVTDERPVWTRLPLPFTRRGGVAGIFGHGDRLFFANNRAVWSVSAAELTGQPPVAIAPRAARGQVRHSLRGQVLSVAGAGERLDLHDVRGARIVEGLSGRATADGCSWDLGALPAGRYIAQVVVDGKRQGIPVLLLGR